MLYRVPRISTIRREQTYSLLGQHWHCSHFEGGIDDKRKWCPSRLLDVGGCSTGKIKLIQTRSDGDDTYSYAALSYRWGNKPTFKRLLPASVKSFEEGVLIEELALTFRDAIAFTQKLGLQYLWIDALCIIQDSSAEWHKEASQMDKVYGNSLINIAATSSTDAEGGLFKERDPIILNGCHDIFPKVQNTKPSAGQHRSRAHLRHEESMVTSSRVGFLQ
jgi:hypothetical protein